MSDQTSDFVGKTGSFLRVNHRWVVPAGLLFGSHVLWAGTSGLTAIIGSSVLSAFALEYYRHGRTP